jgi:hypothetical protein
LIKNTKFKIIAKKFTSIAICALLFIEGMMFYNHHSYAYHVSQATGDIHMLENVLEGSSSNVGLKASVLEAFNIDNGKNNEIQLKNLSKKIVDSTEFAIEIADDMRVVKNLKKAVNEISEVQMKSIDTIQKAVEKIEDESIAEEIEIVYDTAVDLIEKVDEASKEIQRAIDNNQKKIKINIVTSKDHGHHEHEEEIEDEQYGAGAMAANIRTQKKKEEDAIQRIGNIERINLIEKGKVSQRSEGLERRMEKAQRERAAREKQES